MSRLSGQARTELRNHERLLYCRHIKPCQFRGQGLGLRGRTRAAVRTPK